MIFLKKKIEKHRKELTCEVKKRDGWKALGLWGGE